MPVEPLKVFISSRDSTTCSECRRKLGRSSWITLRGQDRALCLACAELDHLAFLASGDAALTRRAGKHSPIKVVVLKWSKSRKRYERQGVLVTEAALARAEDECLADKDVRARRRERAAIRRAELDQDYVASFAIEVRKQFPSCPEGVETLIAEHACRKYSGRVGRSAAAKDLKPKAIRLAVIAHIRHSETAYDRHLADGLSREEARREVQAAIQSVLTSWEKGAGAG